MSSCANTAVVLAVSKPMRACVVQVRQVRWEVRLWQVWQVRREVRQVRWQVWQIRREVQLWQVRQVRWQVSHMGVHFGAFRCFVHLHVVAHHTTGKSKKNSFNPCSQYSGPCPSLCRLCSRSSSVVPTELYFWRCLSAGTASTMTSTASMMTSMARRRSMAMTSTASTMTSEWRVWIRGPVWMKRPNNDVRLWDHCLLQHSTCCPSCNVFVLPSTYLQYWQYIIQVFPYCF